MPKVEDFENLNYDPAFVRLFPGSDWLYFKIYASPSLIDFTLTSMLKEVCRKFQVTKGKKPVFFFLRYYESGSHIRIRFKVDNYEEIGLIAYLMNSFAAKNNGIKKIVIDTYLRETDRYGIANIQNVEKLFCFDTEIVMSFLHSFNTSVNDSDRFNFAVLNIVSYLDAFDYTEERKLEFARSARNNLHKEHNADDFLKKKLNLRFRELLTDVEKYLSIYDLKSPALNERIKLCSTISKLGIETTHYDSIVWSIIHMHINRLFNREQRFYEMVLYDFMEKFFRNEVGKKKRTINLPEKTPDI